MSADLVRFVEARIAVDEEIANDSHVPGCGMSDLWNGRATTPGVCDCQQARVLRQCEAFRRIVERNLAVAVQVDGEWGCGHEADEIRSGLTSPAQHVEGVQKPLAGWCHGFDDFIESLTLLASIWSDHPEFREEWSA